MKIAIYRITIRHDGGVFTVRISATSKKSAIKAICLMENCPESAIETVYQMKHLPDLKQ